MFLGDHWIGTEPYGPYFETIGLDAVVGSVGDGVTMRMISDIKGVKYTEGRLLHHLNQFLQIALFLTSPHSFDMTKTSS